MIGVKSGQQNKVQLIRLDSAEGVTAAGKCSPLSYVLIVLAEIHFGFFLNILSSLLQLTLLYKCHTVDMEISLNYKIQL